MKSLQIISGIVSLIIFLFGLVFFFILPMAGIHFDFNGRGTSMEPAMINSVELRLGPETDQNVLPMILSRSETSLFSDIRIPVHIRLPV